MENTQSSGMIGKAVGAVIIALVVGGFVGFKMGEKQELSLEDNNEPTIEVKSTASEEATNKAVVEKFVQEFKNKANFAIVDELYTTDAKVHLPLPVPQNVEGLKMGGQAINASFSKIVTTPEDIITKGDRVVERSSVTAVNSGPFNGIPATNKPVNWTETHIYQLKNGKIVEQWSEINIVAILAQVSPPPVAK